MLREFALQASMTIHHVFANRSNVGDWLSARGIQALLAPERVVEHLCDDPFVPQTLAALSSLTPNDLVVIGGGGLFMDYFAPFWAGFLPIGERVPFCVWGAGFCDWKRADCRPPLGLVREVVRASRLCVVRDELSRSLLDAANVEVVACPTFAAVEPAPREGNTLLHVDAYDNMGPESHARTVAMLEQIAADEGRPYRQTNNLIPAGREHALDSVLGLYRAADRVVSSRLHGCIVALAMGRPVLAMSGDHKVESFMTAAGLAAWVLEPGEVERLPARLAELSAQPARVAFAQAMRAGNRAVAARVRALGKN